MDIVHYNTIVDNRMLEHGVHCLLSEVRVIEYDDLKRIVVNLEHRNTRTRRDFSNTRLNQYDKNRVPEQISFLFVQNTSYLLNWKSSLILKCFKIFLYVF